jgi:hypothetical protein
MPLGAYPPPVASMLAEQRMRVRQNLQPLGITWIIFGAYRLIVALVAYFVVHSLAAGGIFSDAPPFVPHLVGTLVPVVATLSGIMGLAGILTGYALLVRRPWARTLAIVLGVLALIKIPFGTALGIYTLWVLAPRASWAEWETMTRTV